MRSRFHTCCRDFGVSKFTFSNTPSERSLFSIKNIFCLLVILLLFGGCQKEKDFADFDFSKIEIGSSSTELMRSTEGGKTSVTVNIVVASKLNGNSEQDLMTARADAKTLANRAMFQSVFRDITGSRKESKTALTSEEFNFQSGESVFSPALLYEKKIIEENKLIQIYGWRADVNKKI